MEKRIVIGILLSNRFERAPELQKLFTEFGCNIKTRLGLHNVSDNFCSSLGLMLLEMYGDEGAISDFEAKVREFEGAEVQKMVFCA